MSAIVPRATAPTTRRNGREVPAAENQTGRLLPCAPLLFERQRRAFRHVEHDATSSRDCGVEQVVKLEERYGVGVSHHLTDAVIALDRADRNLGNNDSDSNTSPRAALPHATSLGALGLVGWRRKRKNTAAIATA